MCLYSYDQALSLINGRIPKPMKGWNERSDFARTGRLHRTPRLFRIFADDGRCKEVCQLECDVEAMNIKGVKKGGDTDSDNAKLRGQDRPQNGTSYRAAV